VYIYVIIVLKGLRHSDIIVLAHRRLTVYSFVQAE